MIAAFVILLTFVAGPHHSELHTLQCSDRACVEIVIEQAYQSHDLRRLRVFDASKDGGHFPAGSTAFPPLFDLSFG